jgi:hypothetical protein
MLLDIYTYICMLTKRRLWASNLIIEGKDTLDAMMIDHMELDIPYLRKMKKYLKLGLIEVTTGHHPQISPARTHDSVSADPVQKFP